MLRYRGRIYKLAADPPSKGRADRTAMAFPAGDTYGATVYHGSNTSGLTHLESRSPPYEGGIGSGIYVDFDPEVASFYADGALYELRLLVHRDDILWVDPLPISGMETESVLVGEEVQPFMFEIDGDWYAVFKDDPLRMMRLVRFMAKYGWTAAPEVVEAVKRNAHRIEIVSGERIQGELEKKS